MTEEIKQVLKSAIETEKEAVTLYTHAATKATDSNNKQVYLWLAREEIGHQMLLSAYLNSYEEESDLGSKKDMKDRATTQPIATSEFPSFVKPAKKADVTAGEDEIIRKAIKAETEAFVFYRDMAQKTSDSEAKTIFSELSQIEKGHLELLTEELKWIEDGAGMFLLRRFENPLTE